MGTDSSRFDIRTTPLKQVGYIIGIFALVGLGMGLTGAVATSQLGGSEGFAGRLLSGLLVLVVLTVSFLVGPVVAVIGSLRSADELGSNWASYLTGFVGSMAGYFTMIILVVLIITIGIGIASSGGSSGGTVTEAETGGQVSTPTPSIEADTSSASTDPDFSRFFLPIVAVAIPTGLAGFGASFLGSRTGRGRDLDASTDDLPSRAIFGVTIILVLAVIVIGGAAAMTPGNSIQFGNGDPSNIELTTEEAEFYIDGDYLYADASLVHTGDKTVETTVTARIVINDEVDEDFLASKQITLEPGERQTVTLEIAEVNDGLVEATDEQRRAVNSGDYRFEFLINDEVRSTASP